MRQRLTARRLVAYMGAEKALELMREWGGNRIPVLTAHLRDRIERDEAIRRDIDDGETYSAVGERHEITPGRVAQIVSN